MVSVLPVIALLVIAAGSWFAVRAGSTALRLTGLSKDIAGFQAMSAFFGVGFTTYEAELVINHPVRRKIIMGLMVAGGVGLTGSASALVVTFLRETGRTTNLIDAAVILAGLVLLALATRFRIITRLIDWTVRLAFHHASVVHALDYDTLLRVQHGYVVSEYEITPDSPFAGKSLRQLALRRLGINVLGVTRSQGEYIGAPGPDTEVHPGDVLTVYGEEHVLTDTLHATKQP